MIYNKESIYIINSDNNDNTTVSYGLIKNNIKSEIYYFSYKNTESKLSLIFNLSTNKLVGIYKNVNKGIMFNSLINQFISEYENKNKIMNEIDILINVEKKEIIKKYIF